MTAHHESATNRPSTPIDKIAERWVDTLSRLDPITATYIGRTSENGNLPDFSPEGAEAFASAERAVAAELVAATPEDATDRVTLADLGAGLRLSIAQHEAGEHLRDLNVIASPSQGIRDVFDLMPTESAEDWEQVAARMRAVPQALDGYRRSLREGLRTGLVPARRQVLEVVAQARRTAGEASADDAGGGFFGDLAARAATRAGQDSGNAVSNHGGSRPPALTAGLQTELLSAAAAARDSYLELAKFLEQDLAPGASEQDAFGRERYALASEAFLGATIDLDETYEWGLEELTRMTHEQERIAAEIVGGAPGPGIVTRAIEQLAQDPHRKLHGTDALQRWMQETSDRAVEELGRTQFDIPSEIRTLECMIAPTQEGGIYYTGPSDDFSRPGRMWWSVPEGVTEFETWRELTTVYHEGVPGHHLQIGQAVVNRGMLNEWRRQLAGTSGHAEGWALYAERLMEELGYLDDPADRLGMLDGQRMRAARVVLDIGVHLGKQRPDGSGVWDADFALAFMRENVNMNDGFVRFEVNRYLGWAGQAPSYKVGQRIWEQLRDQARERAISAGTAFDIRAFHRDALALGGLRLDTLQRALAAGE